MFGGTVTLSVNDFVMVWPTLSVAVAVKLYVPAAVDVPLRVPLLLSERPAGNAPLEMLHV